MDNQSKIESKCEDCLYFDWDEESDTEICTLNLDEDEYVNLITGKYKSCPYYRFYDEYKFVQKQN